MDGVEGVAPDEPDDERSEPDEFDEPVDPPSVESVEPPVDEEVESVVVVVLVVVADDDWVVANQPAITTNRPALAAPAMRRARRGGMRTGATRRLGASLFDRGTVRRRRGRKLCWGTRRRVIRRRVISRRAIGRGVVGHHLGSLGRVCAVDGFMGSGGASPAAAGSGTPSRR